MTVKTEVLRDQEIGRRLDEMIMRAKTRCWIATWSLGRAGQAGPLRSLIEGKVPPDVMVVVNAGLGASCLEPDTLSELWGRFGNDNVLRHETSHAKIFVVDKEVIVGSANLSHAAMSGINPEVAIWSRDPLVVRDVEKAFEVIRDGADPITKADVAKIGAHRADMDRAKDKVKPLKLKWSNRSRAAQRNGGVGERHGNYSEDEFFKDCDLYGQEVFRVVRDAAKASGIELRWTTRGFTLRVNGICFCECYSGASKSRQRLWLTLWRVQRRLSLGDTAIRNALRRSQRGPLRESGSTSLRWDVNQSDPVGSADAVNEVVEAVTGVAQWIKGLRHSSK